MKQSKEDPCVYTKFETENTLIIGIWVGDGLKASNNQNNINKLVQYLNDLFEMEHGTAEHLVGFVYQGDQKSKKIFTSSSNFKQDRPHKCNMAIDIQSIFQPKKVDSKSQIIYNSER